MKTETNWNTSKIEEVISALWIIAGLCAWPHIRWLAWVLLIKGAADSLCSIYYSIKETKSAESLK